jgi:hypothetical protein
VHIEEKCWKLHPELNPKNRKKDAKKNNILTMDLRNQVESSFNVDEKIVLLSPNIDSLPLNWGILD